MTYKVVIPSAGIGSRIGSYTKYMNKALVTLGKKPAICHVIDKFPQDVEIVVLLGYLGSQLEEVLSAFYPDRRLQFVYVDKFDGPGSGLGYSLLKARHALQTPFIFVPNDTVISEERIDIDPSEFGNWAGYYKKVIGDGYDVNSYRTVNLAEKNTMVAGFNPKGVDCHDIYIGLTGVRDYNTFWDAMDSNTNSITAGEVIGLSMLDSIRAVKYVNWMDCGSLNALRKAKEFYKNRDANILEKEDEAIWFTESSVIKFSANKNFISDRIKRLEFLPKSNFPRLDAAGDHFYKYDFVNGRVISSWMTDDLSEKLFNTCYENLWRHKAKNSVQLKEKSSEFYRDKTINRIKHYFGRFEQTEEEIKINDCLTPTVEDLLERFDWNKYFEEKQYSRFHGDLHGENIIFNGEEFTFIDWRQNFGKGEYEFGDTYYDLGKLHHGFLVNHGIVDQELFRIKHQGNEIFFDIHRLHTLVNIERKFFDWCSKQGYLHEHISVTTALIFLNICGLHEWPYAKLLYLLGRTMLHENISAYMK